MKKFLLLCIAVCITTMTNAQEINCTAGSLSSILPSKYIITELDNIIISGTIDQRDLVFLKNNVPMLSSINLNDANIVAYSTYAANTIPDNAFLSFKKLKYIALPKNLTHIGNSAFSMCDSLTSITIPASVTSIGEDAFLSCSQLEMINFNATNCTYMGSLSNPSFANCSYVKTIIIGNNVKSIPSNAFNDFYMLQSVTIPASVTYMGTNAFRNCTALTDVYTYSKTPIVLNESSPSFYNAIGSGSKLHVPAGTKADYLLANEWKNFPTIIEDVVIGSENKIWNANSFISRELSFYSDTTINNLSFIPGKILENQKDINPGYILAFPRIRCGLEAIIINNRTFNGYIRTGLASYENPKSTSYFYKTDTIIPEKRFLKFTTTGSSEIKVYFRSSLGGDTRTCRISNGDSILASKDDSGAGSFLTTTTKGSGTVYIYANNSINIYEISATNVGKEQIEITSRKTFTLKNTADSNLLSFNTDSAWTAESDQTWLSLDKVSGTGNSSITFNSTQNTGFSRFATITLKGAGSAIKKIRIEQLGEKTKEWNFSKLKDIDLTKAQIANGSLSTYNTGKRIVPAIDYNKTLNKVMTMTLAEYPNFSVSFIKDIQKPNMVLLYDNHLVSFGKNVRFKIHKTIVGDTISLCVSSKGSNSILIADSGAVALSSNPTMGIQADADADGAIDRYTLKFIATDTAVVLKEINAGIRIYSILRSAKTSGEITTSLRNTSLANIAVYPNPTSDQIKISGLSSATKLTMSTLKGITVLTKMVNDKEIISLSSFPKGSYILKFSDNDKVVVKKLLKK